MTIQPQRAKPISLTRLLDEVAGTVELFGIEHNVLALNGEEYQLLTPGQEPELPQLYEIAKRVIPSMSDEHRLKLTGQALGAVLAIADGRIRDVEAQFPPPPDDPNGERPAVSDLPPA